MTTRCASAVARAQSEGAGVGRALLDAGAVPADVVRQAATDQAVDAVFELLGWAEGDFSFSVDEGNPDDVGIELSTERVVAEAAARREAADRVAAQIASPDVVLAMPVVPPEDLRDVAGRVGAGRARRRTALVSARSPSSPAAATSPSCRRWPGWPSAACSPGAARTTTRPPCAAASRCSPRWRRRDRAATSTVGDRTAGDRRARRRPAASRADGPGAGAAVAASASAAGSLAPRSGSFVPATPAPVGSAAPAQERPAARRRRHRRRPQTSRAEADLVTTIGGPHVPDGVVPPRPEPFQPKRVPDHPEEHPAHPGRTAFDGPRPDPAVRPASVPTSVGAGVGGVNGSAAMAADPEAAAVIERDPSVNRSLLLRLIAGVRGL